MVRHAFSKPSVVNLISKDAVLVLYLSVIHWFTLQTSDYDVIIDFYVSSASLATFIQKVQHLHGLIKTHAVR